MAAVRKTWRELIAYAQWHAECCLGVTATRLLIAQIEQVTKAAGDGEAG